MLSFLLWYTALSAVCVYWRWTIPSRLKREYDVISKMVSPYYGDRIKHEKFRSIQADKLRNLERKNKMILLDMYVRELYKSNDNDYWNSHKPIPFSGKVWLYGIIGPWTLCWILSVALIYYPCKYILKILTSINKKIVHMIDEKKTNVCDQLKEKMLDKFDVEIEDSIRMDSANNEVESLLLT